MRLLKSLLAQMLAFGLVFGIVGCGSDGGGSGNKSDSVQLDETNITIESDDNVTFQIAPEQNASLETLTTYTQQITITEASDINITIASDKESSFRLAVYSDAELTELVYNSSNSGFVKTDFKFSHVQLNAAGAYYISVYNETNQAVNFVIGFEKNNYIPNEGDTAAPVALENNTTHQASISANGISYYKFTVTEIGYYDLLIGLKDTSGLLFLPSAKIYSDPALTNLISSSLDNIIINKTGTYFVAVQNSNSVGLEFDLVVGLSAVSKSEGTLAEPKLLSLNGVVDIVLDGTFSNYYKFTVSDNGHYKIKTGSNNITAYLYDDAAFSNELANGTDSSGPITSPVLTAGTTYYLKVIPQSQMLFNSTITTSLLVEDSQSSPISLSHGVEYGGFIASTGTNYYKYFIVEPSDVNLTVTSAIETDIKVSVFRDSGFTDQVYDLTSSDNASHNFSHIQLHEARTYYIAINSAADEEVGITLDFEKNSYFPNEGWAKGPVALINNTFHQATINPNGTSYYKFTADETGYYDLLIDLPESSEELSLLSVKVYSDSGFSSLISSNTENIKIDKSGPYYFTIKNDNESGITFSLTTGLSSSSKNEGTLADPALLSLDGETKIVLDGTFSNYYKLNVDTTGHYRIETGSSNITAYLYGNAAFNNELANGTDSSNPLNSPLLKAGETYYLKVTSASQALVNSTITISQSRENSKSSPFVLDDSIEHDGLLEASGTNYYKYTATESSDINLTLSSDVEAKLRLAVFNDSGFTDTVYDSGNSIVNKTYYGFNHIQLHTAGTYYIAVYSVTAQETEFDLAFEKNYYITSEGSSATLLLIESNTTHQAAVNPEYSSYYKFTANGIGYYDLLLDLQEEYKDLLSIKIYSDDALTTLISSSENFIISNTGTYYIVLQNNNNFGLSFDLVVGLSSTPNIEGTVAAPKLLSLNSVNDIMLESTFAGYYKFSVENDGYYNIATALTNISSYLYDDSAFSNELANGSNKDNPLTSTLLKAGETYYLKVVATQLTELTPSTVKISLLGEGSVAAPISLNLDSERNVVIGANSTIHKTSYYTFVADESRDYTVVLQSNRDADFYLYSSDTFEANLLTSAESEDSGGETKVTNLSTGTYYIKVVTTQSSYTDATYTIRVLKTATGNDGTALAPTEITPINTPFGSGVASSGGVSYYSFATSDQTVYNIHLSDLSSHTGIITLGLYADSGFSTLLSQTDTSNATPIQTELNSTAGYLKVSNASLSYNLNYNLRVYEQEANQGAKNALVPIAVEVPYSAKVGGSSEFSQFSWYKVTLTEAGDYNITSSDLSVAGQFPNQEIGILSNFAYLKNSSSGSLDFEYRHNGSETLYLKTTNTADNNLTYTLTVSQESTSTATNEGNITDPVALTIDATRNTAKTGKASQLADISRYSFATTGVDDGYYQATASDYSESGMDVLFNVYSDANFTSKIVFYSDGLYRNSITIPTAGDEQYYLSTRGEPTGTESKDITFNLNLNRISEGSAGSPADINASVVGVVGADEIFGTPNESFYTYADDNTSDHTISLTSITGVDASDLNITVYSDSAYTLPVDSATGGTLIYTPGTSPYYFKVINTDDTANASYDISISR